MSEQGGSRRGRLSLQWMRLVQSSVGESLSKYPPTHHGIVAARGRRRRRGARPRTRPAGHLLAANLQANAWSRRKKKPTTRRHRRCRHRRCRHHRCCRRRSPAALLPKLPRSTRASLARSRLQPCTASPSRPASSSSSLLILLVLVLVLVLVLIALRPREPAAGRPWPCSPAPCWAPPRGTAPRRVAHAPALHRGAATAAAAPVAATTAIAACNDARH